MKYRYQLNASVDEKTIAKFEEFALYWGQRPGAIASAILPRFQSVPTKDLNKVLRAIDVAVMNITQRKTKRNTSPKAKKVPR